MLLLAWVPAAIFLQLGRQLGTASWDTLWAEDGLIFLAGAIQRGFSALTEPHAGYMHFVPRFLGLIAASVRIEYASAVFAVGSAFVIAGLSVVVYFASASFLDFRWSRGLLSIFFVLSPAAGYETGNNATNLHWYLFFGCLIALLAKPHSLALCIAAAVAVLAATTSNPMTIFLAPLACIGYLKGGSGYKRAVSLAFVTGFAIQLLVIFQDIGSEGLSGGVLVSYEGSDPWELPRLFGLGVAGPFFVGERYIDNFWRVFRWGFAYAGIALVLSLGAYAGLRKVKQNWVPLTILSYSILTFAFPVLVRGTNAVDEVDKGIYLGGARYVMLPIVLLFAFIIILVSTRNSGESPVLWRFIQGGFGLWTMWVIVVNFSVVNSRSPGPSWDLEITKAKRHCISSSNEFVKVPISPGEWYSPVPCDRLIE